MVAVLAIVARTAMTAPLGLDYPGENAGVNQAGGSIRALVDGDLDRFFESQPPMGSFSLFLRAPFAALAKVDGPLPPPDPDLNSGHVLATSFADAEVVQAELDMYRLGTIPCLLALAAAALAAAVAIARGGDARRLLVAAGLLALFMLNPLIFDALSLGHPEEALAAGLTVGAVLLALHGRSPAAGAALGLASVTKQWALIAAIPVLMAAAPRWRPAAAAAAVAVALFTVPMAIGNPDRFFDSAPSLARGDSFVKPQNIWWPLSRHTTLSVFDGVERREVPRYTLPDAVERLVHPLVAVVCIAVGLIYLRRGRGRDPADLLLLLALVLFLRAELDHLSHPYYFLPFLLALGAWEGLRREGLPLMTLLAAVLLWPRVAFAPDDMDVVNLIHLAWSLPFAAVLATLLFRSPRESAPRPA